MENQHNKQAQPTLVKKVLSLFTRLARPSEDYPVKYYKRGRYPSKMKNRTFFLQ